MSPAFAFAFAIDGESRPGAISHTQVAALATASVRPELPPPAQELADRLQQFVLSTAQKTAARLQP